MQMGNDHVADAGGVHAQVAQGVDGAEIQGALARLGAAFAEAGVDQDGGVAVAHQPDEEIHVDEAVMLVAKNEIFRGMALHAGKAQGIDLVFG